MWELQVEQIVESLYSEEASNLHVLVIWASLILDFKVFLNSQNYVSNAGCACMSAGQL